MTEVASQIQEALARTAGARFWRCALQVNPSSYFEQYRGGAGADEATYNAALVEGCKANGVEVVGIADHGNVEQVDRLRAALTAAGIVVFPGFETQSTEKIHIVCLYAPETSVTDLHQHLGALGAGVKDGDTRPTNLSAEEIGKKVLEQGGVCFLAHVTLKTGVLGLKMHHVWNSDVFSVAQIPASVSSLEQGFHDIVLNKNVEYRRARPMALINAKDVAKGEDLNDVTACTLIKMTLPSLGALRQAFLDPGSRVRLVENAVAADHSRVVAVAWDGGFLDGVRLHLSENLNAVVGGRGTGKSTVIETLRYAFGITPRGERALDAHQKIVAQNLGAGGRIYVHVVSAKHLGQTYTIIREYGAPAEVRDASNRPSKLSPADLVPGIEIIGHDEILEVTKDPNAVRHLIESFVPASSADTDVARAQLRNKLAENRTHLVTAHDQLEALQSALKKLPKLEEQLALFRTHGIEQKLASEALVAREAELVRAFASEFTDTVEAADALDAALPSPIALPDDVDELPSAAAHKRMRASLSALSTDMREMVKRARERIEKARGELSEQRAAVEKKAKEVRRDLDAVIKALPDTGGKTGKDLAQEFRQIVAEAESIRPEQKKVDTIRMKLDRLKTDRVNLLAQWRDAERARLDVLRGAADTVSAGPLSGKLRVSVRPAGDRTAVKKFLQGIDGVGSKLVEWVDAVDSLTVHGLVAGIEQGKDALLALYQAAGLRASVAGALAGLVPAKRHELEEIELLPTVAIELNVAPADAPPIFKGLDQLSTGQRCTAVLYILLAKGTAPLVVDQPEDHLDNAFIADLIVQKLRETKLKRQFLFATHNANIPVLGDAELIAVLKADSRSAKVGDEAVGSVDRPEIQRLAAEVLEGGHEAFIQRQRKYGF